MPSAGSWEAESRKAAPRRAAPASAHRRPHPENTTKQKRKKGEARPKLCEESLAVGKAQALHSPLQGPRLVDKAEDLPTSPHLTSSAGGDGRGPTSRGRPGAPLPRPLAKRDQPGTGRGQSGAAQPCPEPALCSTPSRYLSTARRRRRRRGAAGPAAARGSARTAWLHICGLCTAPGPARPLRAVVRCAALPLRRARQPARGYSSTGGPGRAGRLLPPPPPRTGAAPRGRALPPSVLTASDSGNKSSAAVTILTCTNCCCEAMPGRCS